MAPPPPNRQVSSGGLHLRKVRPVDHVDQGLSVMGLLLGVNRDLLVGTVAILVAVIALVTVGRWSRRRDTGREVDQAADRLRRSLRAILLRNVAMLSDLPTAVAIESNPRGVALQELSATVVDRGKLLTQAQCDAVANAHTRLASIDDLLKQNGRRSG